MSDIIRPTPDQPLDRGLKMMVTHHDYARIEAYAKSEGYRGVGAAVRVLALAALDATEAVPRTAARYFEENEILVGQNARGFPQRLSLLPNPCLLYLRLIPGVPVSLPRAKIKEVVFGTNLRPFLEIVGGGSWAMNRYGGLAYSLGNEPNSIYSLTQVFLNGELWGIDAVSLDRESRFIPSQHVERVFDHALRHYIDVATSLLGLEPPFSVEAGAVGVRHFRMAMPEEYRTDFWELVAEDDICYKETLESHSSQSVDTVLLAIFEQFFDAVAEIRPENFRGFPKKDH